MPNMVETLLQIVQLCLIPISFLVASQFSIALKINTKNKHARFMRFMLMLIFVLIGTIGISYALKATTFVLLVFYSALFIVCFAFAIFYSSAPGR